MRVFAPALVAGFALLLDPSITAVHAQAEPSTDLDFPEGFVEWPHTSSACGDGVAVTVYRDSLQNAPVVRYSRGNDVIVTYTEHSPYSALVQMPSVNNGTPTHIGPFDPFDPREFESKLKVAVEPDPAKRAASVSECDTAEQTTRISTLNLLIQDTHFEFPEYQDWESLSGICAGGSGRVTVYGNVELDRLVYELHNLVLPGDPRIMTYTEYPAYDKLMAIKFADEKTVVMLMGESMDMRIQEEFRRGTNLSDADIVFDMMHCAEKSMEVADDLIDELLHDESAYQDDAPVKLDEQ